MKIFTVFIFTCWTGILFSQSVKKNDVSSFLPKKQITFNHLSVEDGLSQNSAISIDQDQDGFLWIATQDGLNRYDGKSFKYYDKQFEDITRPTYSKLGKIYIDKENTLWIITVSGNLEKYNKVDDTFVKINRFKDVSNIFQDSKNNLFIGTYGKGLFKINKQLKDTIQLFKPNDVSRTVHDFLEIDNQLFVTTNNTVFRFDSNSIIYYVVLNNVESKEINYNSLAISKNKTIWLGTHGNGLYTKSNKNASFVKLVELGNYKLPEHLNIQDLLIDTQERLWVATYGQGVYLLNFQTKTINHFMFQKNNHYTIHYNDILCLFEDYTGTIWFGTDGAGLSYYDEHLLKFNVITNNQISENINIDVVRAISVDTLSNVWIGTSGKGLTRYNDVAKNYTTYTTNNSNIGSNRVMSLLTFKNELWIGHQGSGLDIRDTSGGFTSYNKTSRIKLNASTIWCIYKDSKERIWLGSRDNGLILFDKDQGVLEQYKNTENDSSSLISNNIRVLTEDTNGYLWIGTDDKGLCSLNPETKVITRSAVIHDKIKSLYFDKNTQILWIGTNGNGLKSLNLSTDETHSYTTANGLPNNVIYGILPDDNNNLWLSSNKGITKFPFENPSNTLINYNNYDGLQALEFNTGAYFKSNQGFLYFGGLQGINWFKPSQLTLNPIAPKTIISKIEVFAKERPLISNKSFKYKENTLTFTFAGLHFSQPERNQYKYQLVNHDTNWVVAKNHNTAHYTNLPPDEYTFKVLSSNYDNIWNEIPATYSFTIMRPWYLTNTSKVLYILLALLLIYSVYYYFKSRWLIKTQLHLEHTETERLKQLDEFKTKLYANVSHEFKTPLSLILDPIENQLSKKDISIKDKTALTLVHNNAKRLLHLVNQLMDLSKLEAGSLKLQITQNDLSPFLKQLVSSFKYNINKKKITFNCTIPDIKKVWFDKDALEKIITNLLSNAVKYTPKKGNIILNITSQNNYVVITIINDCISLPKNIKSLFLRYYRDDSHTEGTGIGLALVKELVTLSNGTIVANTINTNEIQFTVTLPIYKEAFDIENIVETEEIKKPKSIKSRIKHILIDEKPLILIVEDDKDVRNYVSSFLSDTYKVITASNGKTGILKALKNIPDLIVSDVMMPITNGVELCDTLKQHELTSHIPIILLTAKSDDESELEGLTAKADDFITKPFKSRILKTRIANLITLRKALQSRYSQKIIHKAKDIAITSLDEIFLNKVEEVLNTHLINETFDARSFSKNMLMSRMQLHRKLKALTGLSTTEFLRSQRLKLAVSLLNNSDHTISEIAYQVGFSSPSYFVKCFKENYASTPNAYRTKA